MKLIIHRYTSLSFFLMILLLGVMACRKKNTVDPVTPTGTLLFHIHTNADANEVEYGTLYTTQTGRKVIVNKAQLYISNIQLIKLDGSVYTVPAKIIYKTLGAEVYEVGEVPVGNYKSVQFQVGLDAATNASTPQAADSVLNQPSMWFGAAPQPQGYVFVNFEGSIDTTTNANGSAGQMQPFTYWIGTNSNYKTVTLPDKNYSIITGQVEYVHMVADYSKLLEGVLLNQSGNLTMATPSDNATANGLKVANNIPSMFRYE